MAITLTEPYLTLAQRLAASSGYTDVTSFVEHLIERADAQVADRHETLIAVREGLADVAAGRVRPIREALIHLDP